MRPTDDYYLQWFHHLTMDDPEQDVMWREVKREMGPPSDYLCAYCGDCEAFGYDHVIPKSTIALHAPSNLQPACRSCNSSKSDALPSDWLARLSTRTLLSTCQARALARASHILTFERRAWWDLREIVKSIHDDWLREWRAERA